MARTPLLAGVAQWDPVAGETPAPAQPWRVDHAPLLEIAREALLGSGALMASIAQVADDGRMLANAVWATVDDGRTAAMMDDAQQVVPSYTLHGHRFDAAGNREWATVMERGRGVLAPFTSAAEGTSPDALIAAADRRDAFRVSLLEPIVVDGAAAGALALYLREPPDLSVLTLARALAGQVAATLRAEALAQRLQAQLDELTDRRRDAVAAEERTRREVAALLHGRAQSRLVVAAALLGESERLREHDPAASRAALRDARETIDAVRDGDLRELSARLHPALLRDGLLPALHGLAERLAPALAVEVAATPAVRARDRAGTRGAFDDELRLAALRIAEEALGNVLRHAGARRAAVVLDLRDDELLLSVRDDGAGFDPARVRRGLGLAAIADRVALAGGAWRLESAPGDGTEVAARLPLA